MAKKKVTRKKAKKKSTSESKDSPEYMVQVNDPKMLRKDILEALREIIIFMQGYEKFRQIQEEKVAMFVALKSDAKKLQNLIDNKLRKHLPKGKLSPISHKKQEKEEVKPHAEEKVPIAPQPPEALPEEHEGPAPPNELDRLESQLKDIEGQLKGMG